MRKYSLAQEMLTDCGVDILQGHILLWHVSRSDRAPLPYLALYYVSSMKIKHVECR